LLAQPRLEIEIMTDERAKSDASTYAEPARSPTYAPAEGGGLTQYQLRAVAAEVVAALAHAVGTPLNVISGRAELIRQDPGNALMHVARIDDQVRKLATGLRQVVDYLSIPEPGGARVAGSQIVRDVIASLRSAAERVEAVLTDDASSLERITLEGATTFGLLCTLGSLAIRCAEGVAREARRIRFGGTLRDGVVSFEINLPGLAPLEGWHLEHFEARPPPGPSTEAYQVLSVCAVLVRGRGGKLHAEPITEASAATPAGVLVRFSSRVGST